MNRAELQKLHEDVCQAARELQVRKNHDYAHEGDIFRNFRRYGTFGVLVRLSDKLARLDSFEENKEFAVADEKLEDTIIDIINYATIYLAMKREVGGTELSKANKIADGPYCDHCGMLSEFRLDENNCDTRYFCSLHTNFLSPAEFTACTRMEKL